MVIVDVPFVKTAFALLLSQLPLTVEVPDPIVSVPRAPTVTLTAVNVLLFMLSLSSVTPPTVVFCTSRFPPSLRALPAIVNVTVPAPTFASKVT